MSVALLKFTYGTFGLIRDSGRERAQRRLEMHALSEPVQE